MLGVFQEGGGDRRRPVGGSGGRVPAGEAELVGVAGSRRMGLDHQRGSGS